LFKRKGIVCLTLCDWKAEITPRSLILRGF